MNFPVYFYPFNVATWKFDLHMCLTFVACVCGSHPVSLRWCCCRVSFLHPWWVRCYPPDVCMGDPILNPPSVTTDRSLDLCEPCFPHLENGYYNSVHIMHIILQGTLLRTKRGVPL